MQCPQSLYDTATPSPGYGHPLPEGEGKHGLIGEPGVSRKAQTVTIQTMEVAG
jgi:hypothetical protein